MKTPNWIKKLENRWQVSTVQVVIILIVFACTGFTVMFLKEPALDLLIDDEDRSGWFTFFYYLLIFPVYNVILLIYGFIFGQFKFFWAFEMKMFRRIAGRNKKSS